MHMPLRPSGALQAGPAPAAGGGMQHWMLAAPGHIPLTKEPPHALVFTFTHWPPEV